MSPESFPRRCLLAVTGLTPQVVTETLYALSQSPQPFVPTEVHLVTTREGAERARLALLSSDPGWFARLLRDYHLPKIAFGDAHIHVLRDARGEPLNDIRTPEDNQRAADSITELVRNLTNDPECALHVSIAGGRKTMGYYLGYALSLFGRPQDRLSHVLVSEPFESSWSFFYPTPYEHIIQVKGDKLADCREARVDLAEIPFVRLREGLPERLRVGHALFSEVVAAANRSLSSPRLVLDVASRRAMADGETVSLTPTEFIVLYWLARRRLAGEPEVNWSTHKAVKEFFTAARRIMNPAGGDYERLERAFQGRMDDPKALGEYFEPHKSRINKAFIKSLGEYAAQRYLIHRAGPPGASRYGLALDAEAIEIRE